MHEPNKQRNRTKEAAVSGKVPAKSPKTDRRVQRTRDALGDALIALMHEKPFDSILVQDVLDRAGVSRSTFYEHYRDKEDLFMSDADEFFEALSTHLSRHNDPTERVVMVREFFGHVAQVQQFIRSLTASGRFHDAMELAEAHFARGIERRLAELPRSRAIPPEQRTALAHAQAGALMSLLQWWVDRGMRESAAQMDDLFHSIFWGGVNAATTLQELCATIPSHQRPLH